MNAAAIWSDNTTPTHQMISSSSSSTNPPTTRLYRADFYQVKGVCPRRENRTGEWSRASLPPLPTRTYSLYQADKLVRHTRWLSPAPIGLRFYQTDFAKRFGLIAERKPAPIGAGVATRATLTASATGIAYRLGEHGELLAWF